MQRFILRAWNVMLLALCLYNLKSLYYQDYLNQLLYFGENLKNDSKRNVLLVLNNIGFVGFYFYTLLVCLFLTFNGNKIIDHLKNQNMDLVSEAVEKRIGYTIVFCQFMASFIIESFLCIVILKSAHEKCQPWKLFVHLVLEILRFFLPYNGQASFIALIAYKSCMVMHQMKNMEINLKSPDRLKYLYRCIQDTYVSVKSFDHLVSNCIFVIIFITSTSCLSLSALAIDPKKFYLISIGTALECLTSLSTICFACNIIPKTFREVNEKINYSSMERCCDKSNDSHNSNDYLLIIHRINDLKHDMVLTACGQYSINIRTFISCIAFILSYAMIIIQTNH